MGTTNQSVGGGITLSGSTLTSPARLSQRPTGDITASGSLSTSVTYVTHAYSQTVGGSIYLYGNVGRRLSLLDSYAGGITVTGTLSTVVLKTPIPRNVSGNIGLSGSLVPVKIVPSTRTGSINLSSTLAKQVNKAIAGSVGTDGDATSGFPQAVAGSLPIAGANVYDVGKLVSGGLVLSSELLTGGHQGVGGSITLDGTLVYRLTLMRSLAGGITLSSELDSINPTHMVSLGGEVQVARVLTTDVTLYTANDVSLMNLASSYDLVIEKGATFYRKFRWLKKDGIPFDLNLMTLRMDIKPYKDSPSYIITSSGTDAGITLTKVASEPGVFTITIARSVTSQLNFTRGIYAINVTFRSGLSARLVEGEVVLSRAGAEVTTTHTQTAEGYISIGGVLIPQRGRVFAKEVEASSVLTTINNFVRIPSGGITLSSTLTKRVSVLKGGTIDTAATLTTDLPTHLSGGLEAAGELTMIKNFVLALEGSIEAAG